MSTPLFQRVCFIGIGMIGSSVARALQSNGVAASIVCADINADYRAKALELGIVSEAHANPADAVKGADIVILAAPVGANIAIMNQLKDALEPGCILTDVGSVKQAVIADITPMLPAGVHFVPGHPIAGGEKSGPEVGDGSIFKNRWCLLTPPAGTDETAIAKVRQMWERCDSNVEVMEASRHDRTLAITSHLPHLIAYTIVDTAANLETDLQADVIKFSAGGFRDSTRMAGSDPTMWRDIFLTNPDAVLEIVQRFTEDLNLLQKAIRKGDGQTLFDLFSRTREIRERVIMAKQN